MIDPHRPGGPDVLTDPAALRAGDRFALLPALATAGAQMRSAAGQLAGAKFDRPRSLIVVDPAATGDGDLAAALLYRSRVPIVVTAALPPWIGPLDLAVVLAAGADDLAAAAAAAQAARSGAALLVRGAGQGAVADAAGAALLAPQVAVPELAARPGRLAVVIAAAYAADVVPSQAGPVENRIGAAADALDAEALACGPGAEPFVNPSVALALALAGAHPLFVADDPVGMALAGVCARSMRLLGGRGAGAEHAAALVPGGQLTAALARPSDPFADPDLDSAGALAIAPVLVPPPGGRRDSSARIAALARSLPGAVLLMPDEADAEPLCAAVALGLRVDLAAAYLGIATGQIAPADGPDGLGPSGGARPARPAATVEDVTRDTASGWGGHPWN